MPCERRTGDAWSGSRCGKSASETINGERLCAPHARAAKAANTRKATREAEREAQDTKIAGWQQRIKAAGSACGVETVLHYSGISHEYKEAVVISLADFERLAEIFRRVS